MPPPILIFSDETWYTKGSYGPVCVSHPGVVPDKNIFLVKLIFHQHGIQQKIAVIFWVTGKIITDLEKQSYKYDMLLL